MRAVLTGEQQCEFEQAVAISDFGVQLLGKIDAYCDHVLPLVADKSLLLDHREQLLGKVRALNAIVTQDIKKEFHKFHEFYCNFAQVTLGMFDFKL